MRGAKRSLSAIYHNSLITKGQIDSKLTAISEKDEPALWTKSGDEAFLTVREGSTDKQRETWVNEWYRDILKEQVERLLPKWEEKTALYSESWQTKYMTTKWGTCNTEKKKLWINLQLAKKPTDCIEYVVLHELIHLRVKNHGLEFVKLMDEYIDYFTRSLNNNADNIMIVCPNHHGIIHDKNPEFDRDKKIYRYPNGYCEGLKLNLHL